MKAVIHKVEHVARIEGVWIEGRWTLSSVTRMWSTIWPHTETNLRTLTQHNNNAILDEKSHQGHIAWRSCYNKLMRRGKNWMPSRNTKARNMSGAGANTEAEVGILCWLR